MRDICALTYSKNVYTQKVNKIQGTVTIMATVVGDFNKNKAISSLH